MARRQHPQDSGERNRAVTIQSVTQGTGPSGFPVETVTTLVTPYWCRKEDVSGRERFAADQLSAPYTTRWEGPYRSDLDPELLDVPKTRRLVYQSREHDIVSASLMSIGDQPRAGIELLTLARNG